MFLGINLPWKKTPSGDVQFGGAVIGAALNYNAWFGDNLFVGPAGGTDGYYVSDSGVETANAGFYISAPFAVTPGEKLVFCGNGIFAANRGGWYLNGTWVSKVNSLANTGSTLGNIVPAGVNQLRMNVSKSDAARYFYRVGDPSLMWSKFRSVSAVGTSITYGYDVYKTANRMDTYWEIGGRKLGIETFRNYGIPASTAAAPGSNPISARMSAVLPSDIVSVEAGYNDWASNIAIGTIADAVNTTFYGAMNIIAQYMAYNFMGKLVLCTPLRPTAYAATNTNGATIGDFADAILAVAKKYGIPVCDHYYNTHTNGIRQMAISQDGIHPNIALSHQMAALWLKAVA